MELGKQIVNELGLDPGVDTLGRWMAHHIAELITDAERTTEPEAKRKKEIQAAETISKVWQHRSAYENRINPLHEFKPILQVLRTLDPDRNVWITNFARSDGNAFAQVYDALRRLVILMVLRKSGDVCQAASATDAHQNEDEKEIIATINAWLSDKQRAAIETSAKKESKNGSRYGTVVAKKTNKADANDSEKLAEELVGYAKEALDKLSAELKSPANNKKDSSCI